MMMTIMMIVVVEQIHYILLLIFDTRKHLKLDDSLYPEKIQASTSTSAALNEV